MASSSEDSGSGAPFETIPAGEANEINETVALGLGFQVIRAKEDESQRGKLMRGVHAKSHGCVCARFIVDDDIEDQYRVGLFAHPGRTYDAWIRFSNASVLREHDLKDGKNGSRGIAIKVMDVDGDMLSGDNGRNNQDFLMINTPEFAFANTTDYLRLNRILARSQKGDDPGPYFIPAILAQLGPPVDGELAEVTGKRQFLKSILDKDSLLNKLSADELNGTFASAKVAGKISARTVRNPLEVQYFGAAPFLFGPGRVMKFSAVPWITSEQAPFADIEPDSPPKDYLHDFLLETMYGEEDVIFDFKVVVRDADDEGLNIEDATTTWPDEEVSYQTIARIVIPVPQFVDTPEMLVHCERLAFSPWHALADHQPLGSINRLRQKVYSHSAELRGAGYSRGRRGRWSRKHSSNRHRRTRR